MLFISELIDKQVSAAALNNVLYSITSVHQVCVYDGPCKTSTVRMNEEAGIIFCLSQISKKNLLLLICCKIFAKCLIKMVKILLI